MFETKTSTVPITKEMVKAAYRKVKANHGAAGVDKESLEVYQEDLLNNLYVLWNRLSSGSYFPKPLRSVSIPKSNGKKRTIRSRLEECKLSLNEEKTKIVYCQDYRRVKKKSFGKKFDFLGFTFKPCSVASKRGGGGMFLGYGCAISQSAQTRIIRGWAKLNWHRRSTLSIQQIADQVNPQMKGIIRYYGKFKLWELHRLMWHFEFRLVKWVLNKYKKFKNSYTKAYQWIKELKKSYPTMFYYWTVFKHV